MMRTLMMLMFVALASASDANHTLIKMISGWDDTSLPTRDFMTGWCHVTRLPTTVLSWDCFMDFTPVPASPFGPAFTKNVTWAGGNPEGPDGEYKFIIGADQSKPPKPLSAFSKFLQDNNFMPHVAEKNPHDILSLIPNANGTDWDCQPHTKSPLQKNKPSCWYSMIQQPEWDMVLWELNVCNDGFKNASSFLDRCSMAPGAAKYFTTKGLNVLSQS